METEYFPGKNEDAVPTEYETDYQVVFHPYDTKKIDYSKEKGWDEDSETVTRKVTVRVSSLKPEVTPTPEATDTPEVTPTPEATPEVTVTPEPTTTPEAHCHSRRAHRSQHLRLRNRQIRVQK